MFRWDHYVPILKWKQGEQRALGDLRADLKPKLTPLIEVQPPNLNSETGEPEKPVEEIARLAIEAVESVWGTQYPIFIDCKDLIGISTTHNQLASTNVYHEATKKGLHFIPVTGLQRPYAEVNAAFNCATHGICIRLDIDDLEDPNLAPNLEGFIENTEETYNTVDLILDLADIRHMRIPSLTRDVTSYLQKIPRIAQWRTLTVTACAFPESMQGIPTSETSRAQRNDWLMWRSLYDQRSKLSRVPAYGDYAIQHPQLIEFIPGLMQVSASIRYSAETEWLLVRGRGLRTPGSGGFDQFLRLSRDIVNMPEFKGSNHCAGCQEIYEKAQPDNESTGNLTTWRKIGTNHHLTLTIEQIAALSSASGSDGQQP